jgi:hypothetical protein
MCELAILSFDVDHSDGLGWPLIEEDNPLTG